MISQQEFQTRREHLAQKLPPNSIAILPAAKAVIRNNDAQYPFRQNSNFYYLTGFEEPEALLVITTNPDCRSILFNRTRNPAEEQWTGRRLGQEGAVTELGMHKAYAINKLKDELPNLLVDKSAIYYPMCKDADLENTIAQALNHVKNQARKGLGAPEALCDLEPILSEMRLFKSPAEIALMRHVASISVDAHKRAMRQCRQLTYEYELEAELIYEFARRGCESVAYDCIVAGGENACVLHYTQNNKALQPGDLVLIDAGGEYQGYAADITRTFPVNGRFSPEQRSLYDLVKRAQQAGIAEIRPGIAWNKVQQVIVQILTSGLCELGLLQGLVEELISREAYRPFYMHNSGHWLGLDVHDSGKYKINNAWRPFEPGMVLTVEPGLYIPADCSTVEAPWRGIGIRIEDDVLVTSTGHEVLTADLPVEIEEIEALMRG
ncbi:MAG: Xaa-Pro aminopeptidase [Legionella sp.]|nr:Xaa-Pro aminopeptidase [Legionella sp.]